MQISRNSKGQAFTVFRTAAEEAETKRENAETERSEQEWDDEGGHMSSTEGRVTHVPEAELPYVVVLTHHESEASEHSFQTMREAEAFIKRNTPVRGASLSPLYDRPASDS